MSGDPLTIVALVASTGILVFNRLDTMIQRRNDASKDTVSMLKAQIDSQQASIIDLQSRVGRCEAAREDLAAENLRLMHALLAKQLGEAEKA